MTLLLRYPRLWVTLGWTFVIAAVTVSLLPGRTVMSVSYNDKVAHTVAYVLLTLWFTGIYPRSRYALIASGLFILGVAVEFAQDWMQLGRQRDFADVIANSTGITVGIALALTILGGWMQKVEGWLSSRG
ncbi:MAG: VanZ family protein [Candidatus Obscuribacterales bacterium]|nr:VanZ family protein [Steroidobacteraceae bacterium]